MMIIIGIIINGINMDTKTCLLAFKNSYPELKDKGIRRGATAKDDRLLCSYSYQKLKLHRLNSRTCPKRLNYEMGVIGV